MCALIDCFPELMWSMDYRPRSASLFYHPLIVDYSLVGFIQSSIIRYIEVNM